MIMTKGTMLVMIMREDHNGDPAKEDDGGGDCDKEDNGGGDHDKEDDGAGYHENEDHDDPAKDGGDF